MENVIPKHRIHAKPFFLTWAVVANSDDQTLRSATLHRLVLGQLYLRDLVHVDCKSVALLSNVSPLVRRYPHPHPTYYSTNFDFFDVKKFL